MGASAEGEELQMQKKKKKTFLGLLGARKRNFRVAEQYHQWLSREGRYSRFN